LDCFSKLEQLIDAGSANLVAESRALLTQIQGKSHELAQAVDEFLLDIMTLEFLLEAEREAFHSPARRLARMRLTMVKLHST
jgi:ribose 1,5-bisphosphokinase PhnN